MLMRCISMEIAKAVVLAGKCPSFMPWPNVGCAARQLTAVANRPVLFHHLDALCRAGVRQAAIVTDPSTAAGIRAAVGAGEEWDLALTHVESDAISGALASSELAGFVGDEPVHVHYGDVLLRERLSALAQDFAEHDHDALILRGGAVGPGQAASAGYIIGAHLFAALQRRSGTLDDALLALRRSGRRVAVREVDACMPCRGDAQQLLEANRRMLEEMAPGHCGERVFKSEIQGMVALHPSAEVRNSVIRGPVVIGPGARVADTYVGPYTSIGAGVELEGVEIEHSIVFDRAQLRFLGSRVEGSLIGPGACVTRGFDLPRALRLSIGEGARVSIAA
jgi:glucose-1-phosphate thymidylyltransferase